MKLTKEVEEKLNFLYTKVFYKSYKRMPKIKLLSSNSSSFLDDLFITRGSIRNFSQKEISFEEISSIFSSCRIIEKDRFPEKRTYPSGGARFPIEVYLISFRIGELDNGAYHFNIKNYELEILIRDDYIKKIPKICSEYITNPSGVLIFTAMKKRTEVKYGKSQGKKLIYLEAGHIAQNIILKCSELGVDSCPIAGFDKKVIKDILDLISNEEIIYVIAIGKK